MHCRRVRKSLMEYAEGGLNELRRDQVARHVASCEECAGLAEKLSLSASALSTLEPLRMGDEASLRVGARLESERGLPSGGGFMRSPRALATAGLVAAALVAAAIVVGITVPGGPAKKSPAFPEDPADHGDRRSGPDGGDAVRGRPTCHRRDPAPHREDDR